MDYHKLLIMEEFTYCETNKILLGKDLLQFGFKKTIVCKRNTLGETHNLKREQKMKIICIRNKFKIMTKTV